MAKRRQLDPPSPEALQEMEEGFARETPRAGARPPIADVAADAAANATPLPVQEREEQARDRADAQLLKEAREKGLVAIEIPIGKIEAETLTRDRMDLDEDELNELSKSISLNGVRLPIEVYAFDNPGPETSYGLISGYRRLAAVRKINEFTDGERFPTIPAFVRDPETYADAYAAMVEENEVRSDLSQYERGRIVAMAVYREVFKTMDEAVNKLFWSASKAKKSKIRSFAMIHEELGDMLNFAPELNERQCLRIAHALRSGRSEALRDALYDHAIPDAETEWKVMLPIIELVEEGPPDPSKGGRPRKTLRRGHRIPLANDITMEKVVTEDGYAIRLRGDRVTNELVESVMGRVRWLLEEI